MILENILELVNDVLGGIVLNLLGEHTVGLDNLVEFVGEIIFGPLIVILDDGWADLRRGDREHGANHPVRTAPEAIEPHEIHVIVGDATEELEYVFDLEGHRGLIGELGNNAGDGFLGVVLGLLRAAPVLGLLPTAAHLITLCAHGLPSILATTASEIDVQVLVNTELSTLDTNTLENVADCINELDVIDGASEFEMTKVAWAAVIRLSA